MDEYEIRHIKMMANIEELNKLTEVLKQCCQAKAEELENLALEYEDNGQLKPLSEMTRLNSAVYQMAFLHVESIIIDHVKQIITDAQQNIDNEKKNN